GRDAAWRRRGGRARRRLRVRARGPLQLPGRSGLLPAVRIRGVRRPRRGSGGVHALLHSQTPGVAAPCSAFQGSLPVGTPPGLFGGRALLSRARPPPPGRGGAPSPPAPPP